MRDAVNWKAAAIEQVQQIVERDLAYCNRDQVALFERYRVQPHFAPIVRLGSRESVVVIAQRGAEVIYWEDVEEGSEISPIDLNGEILEPGATKTMAGTDRCESMRCSVGEVTGYWQATRPAVR